MEGNVPIFIQTGAEVLSSFISSFSIDEFVITPGLLRQIRVGEVSQQQVKQLLSIVELAGDKISKYYDLSTINDIIANDVTGSQSILVLCAVAIKEKLWLNRRIHEQHEYYKQYCPHLVADAIRDVQPLTGQDCSSIPLQPITMESLLLRYGRIINKLKKLKLLELERLSLIEENMDLATELIESSAAEKLLQNFADGVQLIGSESIPTSSSSSSSTQVNRRKTASTTTKSSSTSSIENITAIMQVFEEEIQYLKDYDKILEEDRNNEYLFWRWMLSFPVLESMSASLLPTPTTIQIVHNEASQETTHNNDESVVMMHPSTVQMFQELHTAMQELEDHILHIVIQKKVSLNTSVIHSHCDRILTHFLNEITDLTFSSRAPHLARPASSSSSSSSSSHRKQPMDETSVEHREIVVGPVEDMLGIPILFPAFTMTRAHQVLYQLLHWDHPVLLQEQYYPPRSSEEEEPTAEMWQGNHKDDTESGLLLHHRMDQHPFTTIAVLESREKELQVKQCDILQEISTACNKHSPYRVVFR